MRKCQICGHPEEEHFNKNAYIMEERGKHWCQKCSDARPYVPTVMFHTFKLDNLSYVEELAKEKGLI